DWISRISPVYYYNLTKPLVPGFHDDPSGPFVLLALSLVLSAAGVWLFLRRDAGGTVRLPEWLRRLQPEPRPRRALPVDDWSLRSIYGRSLAMIARPTVWWTLGIAGFAAWMVVVVKQTESLLVTLFQGSPLLKTFVTNLGGSS